MRSALVLWLLDHGLPVWLAPDYAVMVGLAGILGAAGFLRLARADRADVEAEKRAIAIAYIAALLGGYVFEAIRAAPEALAERSWAPVLGAGRAAYGGLLAGLIAPIVYLRYRRLPIAPFLDRSTIVLGVSFALVRVGCFLSGCDYGRPTASLLGVRFPAGSEAALDHASRGWVQVSAPSLPVHPTELYEAALGIIALGVASVWLRRGIRDGRAFSAWIATYATGRFAIEILRGDAERGVYTGVSTAQIVSIALLAALGAYLLRKGRGARAATAGIAAALTLGGAGDAGAQKPSSRSAPPAASATPSASAAASAAPSAPPAASAAPSTPPAASAAPPGAGAYPPYPGGYPPYPGAYPYPGGYPPYPGTYPPPPPPASADPSAQPPPAKPKKDDQIDGNARVVGLRAAIGAAFTLGNARVPTGGIGEISGVYRFAFSRRSRFQLGLELRGLRNSEASHLTLGVPLELVLGVASHLEFNVAIVPGHTWIFFDSPFFSATNAWGSRFEFGLQFPIGSRVALGVAPVSFNLLSSQPVGVITTYEPKLSIVVGVP